MRYLIAGLIIGGVAGQMWGYAVAGQHPLRVEVPVVGECQQPEQVSRLVGLMATMPLAVNITDLGTRPGAAPAPAPRPRPRPARDEIGLLIAMGDAK